MADRGLQAAQQLATLANTEFDDEKLPSLLQALCYALYPWALRENSDLQSWFPDLTEYDGFVELPQVIRDADDESEPEAA